MVSHVSLAGAFSLRKKMVPLFITVFLFTFAVLLPGCKGEPDPFVDDDKLNTGLIGTWQVSGDGWTDTYTIGGPAGNNLGTINHPQGFTWTDATIEFVYNFNETSGCLIVKYTVEGADKFNAVYFKNLSSTQVLLGDAYTVADYTIDPAVGTLEEAKTKFAPENAPDYGGGAAQTGTPQQKQPQA